jgi:hypothetical protein
LKKKLLSVIVATGILLSGVFSVNVKTTEGAIVTQQTYKLTAYNQYGKKVDVKVPTNFVVVKSTINGWYKGTLKYTDYKKVGNKWVKGTKTSLVVIPAKAVQVASSKTTWVKHIETFDDTVVRGDSISYFPPRFLIDKDNEKRFQNGEQMFVSAGTPIYWHTYQPFYTKDANGNNVIATTIQTEKIEPMYDSVWQDYEFGPKHIKWGQSDKLNIKYIGYRKTLLYTYKTKTTAQAYTKVYVPKK